MGWFGGNKTPNPEVPKMGWGVIVSPATKQTYEGFYDIGYKNDTKFVEGKVAVRLTLDGQDRLTYGVVMIKDNDFEDKITSMKAEAMEKASALNAVGAK